MKNKAFLGLLFGTLALAVPAFTFAQSNNYPSLLVSIQTTNGSSISSQQGTVTVNGNGASLSGYPSGNGSLTYYTNFNNDNRTVTFNPGSYSVTISPVSNYTYSYSSGCNGYLNYGNTSNCTVTVYQNGNNNNCYNNGSYNCNNNCYTNGYNSGYNNNCYGNGTLTVYVQVTGSNNCYCGNGNYNCCNNYNNSNNNCSYNGSYNYCNNNNNYNYSPSNFTINVSGNSVSPSSFQGSSSGTSVSLGSGYYSVNPQTQNGWTYTMSGNCSGTMNSSQSYSCTVTYSPTNSQNCSAFGNLFCNNYPYNNYPYNNNYSYNYGGMVCSPSNQTVPTGGTAVFTATGGTGSYVWTSNGYTYTGNGSTLNAQFYTPGSQTVTVTSDAQTASCSVNVTGTAYNNYTTPTYSYTYPHLPNTGFAPIADWQYALAAILLLAFGYLTYPYVRNALTYLRR